MNNMTLHIDSGLLAIQTWKEDWKALYKYSKSSNPFLSWEWNYYWASNFSNPLDIRILIGKLDGVVNCIVPLQIAGNKMFFLRDRDYADYGGLLVSRNLSYDHLKAVIDRIMQESHRLSFEAIRSDSLEFGMIESLLDSKRIQPVVTYMCDNPYVAKNDDFESYYKTRSKKLRQEIRTTENHLRRMGQYRFVEEVRGENFKNLLDRLADFHLKRQSEKIGASVLANKKNVEFFKDAPLQLNSSSCQLHMSAIVLNDRVISAALSIQTSSTLYYWIPSFDTDIPKVSLGKLHIKLLIEKCHDQNMAFDFMGGDEKYKYQWADNSLSVMKYVFFKSDYETFIYKKGEWMRNLLKSRVGNNRFIRKFRVIISNYHR